MAGRTYVLSDNRERLELGEKKDSKITRTLKLVAEESRQEAVIELTNQDCVDFASALISHMPGFTIAFSPIRQGNDKL